MFRNSNTAVARLLQYGSESVAARGFDQFESGLPTIEGLTDFANRFRRVSEIADQLFKPENASVANALAQFPEAIGSVLQFDPKSAANASLIDELIQANIAISPEKVVRVSRAPNGVVTRVNPDGTVRTIDKIFLELGQHTGPGEGAGFAHILAEHADDFAAQGIPTDQLADVVMNTLTNGRRVGVQGSRGDRIIYEYMFNGETRYMSITVGSNGFVVGANPASSNFNP